MSSGSNPPADPLIAAIGDAWGWLDLEPVEVVAINAFGNVIFTDVSGRYWRLCPEELECSVLARDRTQYDEQLGDADFLADWEMLGLVDLARRTVGSLEGRYCYCLRVPAPLGGEYQASNLSQIPHLELIAFSGHVAGEIRDLPDGSEVRFRLVD